MFANLPKIRAILSKINMFFIYLKHLFTFKTLKVKAVEVSEIFVINGAEINLCWDVKGCYKIEVEGIITVPSSINKIKLLYFERLGALKVTFYGVGNTLTKFVEVNCTKIDIISDFNFFVELPELEDVANTSFEIFKTSSITHKKLYIQNSFTMKINSRLSESVKFNLPSFKEFTNQSK
jgi:hypothetical protein